MRTAIFDQLGGFAKVRLLVAEFYDRALDSESLAPYFQGIDVRRLIDHQTKFISSVMGGPASFTDEHLARAHRHLRVRPEHFDEMGEVLRETLEDFDVDPPIVARILAQVVSVRAHIVDPSLDTASAA